MRTNRHRGPDWILCIGWAVLFGLWAYYWCTGWEHFAQAVH